MIKKQIAQQSYDFTVKQITKKYFVRNNYLYTTYQTLLFQTMLKKYTRVSALYNWKKYYDIHFKINVRIIEIVLSS